MTTALLLICVKLHVSLVTSQLNIANVGPMLIAIHQCKFCRNIKEMAKYLRRQCIEDSLYEFIIQIIFITIKISHKN